ncbi:hypothetical protein ACE01N_08810 [Saccharicrinis sp. FJH2]|uniref:hypothetical protein n=1 Tax=Saccharicrinis sp. FJH65 TaxID=3344659 RepID=UPI0035F29C1C
MSKAYRYLILTVSFVCFSCSKNAEFVKKPYPAIQTLDVTNISSNGVTFNGEVLQSGIDDIIEYGFVFYPVGSDISNMYDTIMLQSTLKGSGAFSLNADHKLSNNVTYNVKAYAKTLSYDVTGPTVEFNSQGCKNFPWDFYLQTTFVGYENIFTTSINNLGYLLMSSMEFYTFNPATCIIQRLKDYPGHTLHSASFFIIDEEIYIIKNNSSEFYKYRIDLNDWVKLNALPFMPGEDGFTAFALNNQGYYVSNDTFYQYEKSSDNWEKKSDDQVLSSILSSETVNHNAYVFTRNKSIWKFSEEEDKWQMETTYPDTLLDNIVSFRIGDNLYYGFSYDVNSTKTEASSDFWQYSVNTKSWTKTESIPYRHTKELVFCIAIENYGYLGYCTAYNYGNRRYNLWKFSEEKIPVY